MFGSVFRPSIPLRNDTKSTVIEWSQTIIGTLKSSILFSAIAICLIFSLSIIINETNGGISNNAYAQVQEQKQQRNSISPQLSSSSSPSNEVTIHLNSVTFAPLDNNQANQLKVVVDYKTNDPALVNTPMTGTMKVYLSDGMLLKTSSIPKGFVLGQSGPIQFATSFADKTIQDVKADVYLTNTLDTERISNTLTINASLVN